MNLIDIITLAKAGYKPADIKELVALATPEPVTETTPEQTEAVTDYKALYEEAQEELKKVKAEAIEAQRANNSASTMTIKKVDEITELQNLLR